MENTEQSGQGNRNLFSRLGGFGLSIMVIWLFMFQVAPRMEKFSSIQPIVNFIEERSIDADALLYTEIEEFSEANINMENTMDYMPRGAN